jgi:hypothetical protein
VKLFKSILLGLAILLAMFIVVGLLLGKGYRVERSVVVDADPGAIHRHVGDLRRWAAWTPWTEQDSTVVVQLGERVSGVGASQSWTSATSGGGRLVITASSPIEGVAYDTYFDSDPHPHRTLVAYDGAGVSTRVTWSMEGEMSTPIVGGYFALLADRLIGPMFERGLNKLRTIVEEERRLGSEAIQ